MLFDTAQVSPTDTNEKSPGFHRGFFADSLWINPMA